MSFEPVKPSSALYIKLGRGGNWERECIEGGFLRIGFNEADHQACLQGDWETVRENFLAVGLTPGTASNHTTQVTNFYTASPETLWFTFYGGHLYWCFAQPRVYREEPGTKVRKTTDGWRYTDIKGNALRISDLSGRLTKTAAYRGTICEVAEFDYLVDRINGRHPPAVQEAEQRLSELQASLEQIIRALDPREFEILVDLIFREAGWLRYSQLGEELAFLDMDLHSPITGERFGVQVKAAADRSTAERYKAAYQLADGFAKFYLVVHSPQPSLTSEINDDSFELVLPDKLARWALDYGLASWVIKRGG